MSLEYLREVFPEFSRWVQRHATEVFLAEARRALEGIPDWALREAARSFLGRAIPSPRLPFVVAREAARLAAGHRRPQGPCPVCRGEGLVEILAESFVRSVLLGEEASPVLEVVACSCPAGHRIAENWRRAGVQVQELRPSHIVCDRLSLPEVVAQLRKELLAEAEQTPADQNEGRVLQGS
mgnify:CR=1 FL=1